MRDYKEWRNSVLSLRDEERRHSNMLKHHQVELVEEWQVSTKRIIFVRIKFSNSSKNSFHVSILAAINFCKNPYPYQPGFQY